MGLYKSLVEERQRLVLARHGKNMAGAVDVEALRAAASEAATALEPIVVDDGHGVRGLVVDPVPCGAVPCVDVHGRRCRVSDQE